ncbi:hypothetical protein [Roseateles depolymerans]|uniref:Uncharacterized protein n=1 Tax=Roseateles depolymerans TaxID=76731 RepID=A0A0U2U370_9BURK|nr:hypothetical protein [Roseateles depolymerans]ALV06689.1 hypothetical protein RD2015_2217 [Roseateles depolymerans]REG19666.1 hypothetical protein DES44_2166 [Roseateles depolymerans]
MTTTITLPLHTRKKRDWFRILRDLSAAGVSMSLVARKCGLHSSTVRMWAEGSEPKESDARTVLAIYARVCPAKYREHQAQFSIRAEMERTVDEGENFDLPFVDDTDE